MSAFLCEFVIQVWNSCIYFSYRYSTKIWSLDYSYVHSNLNTCIIHKGNISPKQFAVISIMTINIILAIWETVIIIDLLMLLSVFCSLYNALSKSEELVFILSCNHICKISHMFINSINPHIFLNSQAVLMKCFYMYQYNICLFI